jgi:hypothetical protein
MNQALYAHMNNKRKKKEVLQNKNCVSQIKLQFKATAID